MKQLKFKIFGPFIADLLHEDATPPNNTAEQLP